MVSPRPHVVMVSPRPRVVMVGPRLRMVMVGPRPHVFLMSPLLLFIYLFIVFLNPYTGVNPMDIDTVKE
jgi:hypothetical protein